MNKIQWFTGNDAVVRLEKVARQHLGAQFDFAEMPIDHYIPGHLVQMQAKADFNGYLFIKGFFHHPQYASIYKALTQLLSRDICIAVASYEMPDALIAEYCVVNPLGKILPADFNNEAIPSLEESPL